MQQCPHCGETLDFSKNMPRFCSGCGQALRPLANDLTQPYAPPTTAPQLTRNEPTPTPDSIGGYRLLRPLGEGGMGSVYEGEELTTGRHVAVKLIRAEFADSADAVERFRREGRLAGTIAHPRCVFVLAADEEAGRPYIVMELMPGLNLADLVEQNGVLAPQDAVARILDVIEGLQEAHRCGLIHRDVKPSNCFVDTDGRVKVGDFGLSKALAQDAHLTQSGAFLGTLLYAAPEQIRNDVVDHQADVYSVAATLYFLLTGRAPFQTDDDAAATLARTMTDPVRSMRKLRPAIPATLDRVVLRGLARPRDKRWQNLEELRLALLPFVPGRHSLAEVGWRVGACLLDTLCVSFVEVLLLLIVFQMIGVTAPTLFRNPWTQPLVTALAANVLMLGYFGIPESLWGGSPGKLLLRLRVRTVPGNDRPGLWRALGRTFLYTLQLNGLAWAAQLALLVVLQLRHDPKPVLLYGVFLAVAPQISPLVGWLLMASTMRRRNGYRALHDFLSGTVVIRLPALEKPRVLSGVVSRLAQTPMPSDMPQRLGTFTVLGVLSATPRDCVLLGEDGALQRRVWLWLRSEAEELPTIRREVSRTTRPRWLAAGRADNRQWDAFVASPGFLLADALVGRPRLFWPEALPILKLLADELAAACADGTLPRSLSVEQIWIETTGRVQLLDRPLREPAATLDDADPERRALHLLRRVVALALEGRARGPGKIGPVRAPLPGPAAEVLRRLMAQLGTYATVREFHTALEAARERPVEITRTRRAVHLAGSAAALALGLFCLLLFSLMPTLAMLAGSLQGEAALDVALERLETASGLDVAALASTPDPLLTLAAAAQQQADLERQARLERKRDHFRQERSVALGSSSWFPRRMAASLETMSLPALRNNVDMLNDQASKSSGPRQSSEQLEEFADRGLEQNSRWMPDDALYLFGLLALWPILWTLWAGATRGGLGFWLAGVRLVQADGRRAARWRCAWRALLVWVPILALLATSMSLEVARMLCWEQGGAIDAMAWAAWVSWALWWLAWALLPLYAWLALRSPPRGWHDRLAGTYLVPR